jgi:hypothetical protein
MASGEHVIGSGDHTGVTVMTDGQARLTVDEHGAVVIPGTLTVTGALTGTAASATTASVATHADGFTGADQLTVGSSGSATALPSNPEGYVEVTVHGGFSTFVVPYYKKS